MNLGKAFFAWVLTSTIACAVNYCTDGLLGTFVTGLVAIAGSICIVGLLYEGESYHDE